MIIRRKLYSLNRTIAGIKGGLKMVPKSLLTGGLLIPGNGLALLLGKKKLAAGITAAGALIGGVGGYVLGRSEALNKYDYEERLKNDPEFRKKEEKKKQDELKKLQNTKCPIFPGTSHFKKKGRKYGVEFEPILFKYFNWLEKFYSKNWSRWYKSITFIDKAYSFSYIFLHPADDFLSFSDLEENGDMGEKVAIVLWDPVGQSDHQYMYFNPDNKSYKYNFPLGYGYEGKTLVESLTKYVSQFLNYKELNSTQKSIIEEYLNGIKNIK